MPNYSLADKWPLDLSSMEEDKKVVSLEVTKRNETMGEASFILKTFYWNLYTDKKKYRQTTISTGMKKAM